VKIVHRRPEFRASAIMLDRAKDASNIELVTPYVVETFDAGKDGSLATADLKNTQGGDDRRVEIDGAFIAIGHEPNSKIIEGQVELDEEGYVVTEGKSTRTKLPGVFAAGDLVDHTYRQAVTAAGSGCQAALDAEWYLRDRPPDPEAHWAAKAEATAPAAPR
jgi:thioredoxin reductase (NADPH)